MDYNKRLPPQLEVFQYPDMPFTFKYKYAFRLNVDLLQLEGFQTGVKNTIMRNLVSDFKETLEKVVFGSTEKEMKTNQLIKINKASISWWENKRPIEWMVETHLENPTVNCFNDAEKILAEQVAAYVGEYNG